MLLTLVQFNPAKTTVFSCYYHLSKAFLFLRYVKWQLEKSLQMNITLHVHWFRIKVQKNIYYRYLFDLFSFVGPERHIYISNQSCEQCINKVISYVVYRVMKEVRIAEKTALNTGLCEFSYSGHSLLCIARIYETPNKVLTLEDQNIIQTFKNEKKSSWEQCEHKA